MTVTEPLRQHAGAVVDRAPAAPQVEIVIPVRIEERDLEPSIHRLHAHLTDGFPFTTGVTIVDNGSTDRTWQIARTLAQQLPGVRAVRLDLPGRGRALAQVWSGSDAAVLAYMDVDLSTDLNALLPLVAPLLSGHSDLAIGSRLSRTSRVTRGPKREVISRCYNALLRAALGARFSDAQCGFKAIRAERARMLLPFVQDTGWFFDTELLVLAERAGLCIHEVPVDWVVDPDSRVDLVATAVADLKGVVRLATGLVTGAIPVAALRDQSSNPETQPPRFPAQVARFAAIGVASTLAYVLLYLAARVALPAQAANALALVTTAVANTAANRHFTFAIHGPDGVVRDHLRGLAVFAFVLGVTAGLLAALHAASPQPARTVEVAVLVGANLLATLLRFVLLRGWVFRSRRGCEPAVPQRSRSTS